MFHWEQIYQESWLLKAALKLHTKTLFDRQKAFTASHDGQTFFDFAQNSPRHIKRLHQALQSGRFVFRPAEARHHVFNGKSRTLYLLPWEERIVDTMLYLMLNDLLGSQLSKNCYAYRMNGLTLAQCQKKIARLTSNPDQKLYIIKRDISDYFASIHHPSLTEALRPYFDDRFWQLIEPRIRFAYMDQGENHLATKGIPFGCASACFFANWYLKPLDDALDKLTPSYYFRYSDDCLFVTENKDIAQTAIQIMDQSIQQLHIQFKPKHHHNWLFGHSLEDEDGFLPINRFKHLGLEFRAQGPHGLSKDKLRKIRNLFLSSFKQTQKQWQLIEDSKSRIKHLIKMSQKTIEQGIRSVALLDYYLDHTSDESQLKELDRWLALEILSQALNKGHNKGLFKHSSFAQLRRWGLPSLCHRSRKLRHGQITKSFLFWKKPVGSMPHPDRSGASL